MEQEASYDNCKEAEIDLKWSLWSVDRESWVDSGYGEEYSLLMQAHAQEIEIDISTAPKKEIRFGNVRIAHGTVTVEFSESWDSYRELARGWGDKRDRVPMRNWRDWLEAHDLSPDDPSIRISKTIEIGDMTFEQMMQAIDDVENEVVSLSKELSAELREAEREWVVVDTLHRKQPA